MRIFITGATGFVGSHVARLLILQCHKVAVLVRSASAAERLLDIMDQVEVITGDLDDPHAWLSALHKFRPDVCLHLAWYAEPTRYLEARQNVCCLDSGLSLLEQLAHVECHRAIYVGSCAEYGGDGGYLRETSPTQPTTLYAASKLALSVGGSELARQLGISFVWARLFYLYGPYEDPRRLIPALIRCLLGGEPFPATDGTQVRDYLHVEDAACALVMLATGQAVGSFNIASSVPLTVKSMMECLGGLLGRRQLIRYGELDRPKRDPQFICGDNTKLQVQTGWRPHHTLEEGLASTIEWWRRAGTGGLPH